MKILFVLKKRGLAYGTSYGSELSSGLINSAKLIKEMLDDCNVESKIVEVNDNNCIDREVFLYKPTHVIVEAIWVVPAKFIELKRLHPKVKWIVRVHSEIPFLANEGIAIDWINGYLDLGISISVNSSRAKNDLSEYAKVRHPEAEIILLPNYYKIHSHGHHHVKNESNTLNIACFGAIRPLKNQLIQAMAAITYAEKYNKKLKFHINATRLENSGSNNVLKNIRALFLNLGENYQLVEHPWYEHFQFIQIIQNMDLSMQVSLSETFNIVTADFVSQKIPVIVSEEITWVHEKYRTNCNNMNDIVETMRVALHDKKYDVNNLHKLEEYNELSQLAWLEYFNHIFSHKSSFLSKLKKKWMNL